MKPCETCKTLIGSGYVMDNGVYCRHYCDDCKPQEYNEWYRIGYGYWTVWIDDEGVAE
ncbi:hypothetical protein [Sporosarcina jiandibaonis]|uniref:hypothetical protein n=1 Tax=Sporosarcina jiandibaonis TaxID=2715535 RepID=UPI001554C2B8|nr:hypothetical protein [Sporosarcina jiandibaonis]